MLSKCDPHLNRWIWTDSAEFFSVDLALALMLFASDIFNDYLRMLLRFHLSTLRHIWFCWCLGAGQATGHYPNEWWPGSLTYVYMYRPQRVNSNWTWITTRRLFHWKSLRIFVLIAFTLFNAYFCSNISQNISGHYLTWWRSSNEGIFRVAGPLRGEFTGHLWIPLTGASDAEFWCFLWSPPE